MFVIASAIRPNHFPVATLLSPVFPSVSICSFLRCSCILFLGLVADTSWASTGTRNAFFMAVVVAVATLFSERNTQILDTCRWTPSCSRISVFELRYFLLHLLRMDNRNSRSRGSSTAGLDRGRSWVFLIGNGYVELSKRVWKCAGQMNVCLQLRS